MQKRFLKGVAFGGLLAGLAVWAHTTPKGKQSKALAEEKLKEVWAKIEKEYKAIEPEKIQDLKKEAVVALKSWQKSTFLSADVKRALAWAAKKLVK